MGSLKAKCPECGDSLPCRCEVPAIEGRPPTPENVKLLREQNQLLRRIAEAIERTNVKKIQKG